MVTARGGRGGSSDSSSFNGMSCEDNPECFGSAATGTRAFQKVRLVVYFTILGLIVLYGIYSYIMAEINLA